MVDNSHDTNSKVKEYLQNNLMDAEFKLALFSAALISYRKDTCLRPLPDYLMEQDGVEKLEFLESLINLMPPLENVKNGRDVLSEECWRLLHWLFIDSGKFSTHKCSIKTLKDLQSKTGESSFSLAPDYIFEIKYKTKASQKFDEQSQHYGIKYGYHGSRMDNFYSIVSNGLQVHMMKTGVYGEGVYLSEDLAVTMPYVTGGNIWKHSILGKQVSCVAVCEILDHPGVKCQVEKKDETENGNRSFAKNSELGEVPEKYFVVTSSDLVRVKYILLFIDQKHDKSQLHVQRNILFRYPVATILMSYMLFLCLMSIWKSHSMKVFIRKHFKSYEYEDD